MENHKAELVELPAVRIRRELAEMRSDLINLQKSASCALSHLEQILQALEKGER